MIMEYVLHKINSNWNLCYMIKYLWNKYYDGTSIPWHFKIYPTVKWRRLKCLTAPLAIFQLNVSVTFIGAGNRYTRENHWPVTSHWGTSSHNVAWSGVHLAWFELTLVVIGTDCIGQVKARKYHFSSNKLL